MPISPKKSSKIQLSCVLEYSVIRLCSHRYEKVARFFSLILTKSIDSTLTRFHHSNRKLPIMVFSSTLFVKKESFSSGDFSNQGQALEFVQSYFKINVVAGTSESIEFIKSIINSENNKIFYTNFINNTLTYKWSQIRFLLYWQASGYTIYLVLLSAYGNLQNFNILSACFALNINLIIYEVAQMLTSGKDYLTDPWNYMDLIRAALMTLLFFYDLYNVDYYFNFLLAATLFFTWIRGVSYFRIFTVTRYYINLIYEVIIDILPFLTILFYSTIGFSLTFENLQASDRPYFGYVTESWEINVGGFDTSSYGKLMYLAFFLHTVINPIIMLNLLISIMSNTFGRVNSQVIVADSRELAGMILEAELMLFWRRNSNHRMYLHVCKSISETKVVDPTIGYLKLMKRKILMASKGHSDTKEKIEQLDDFMNTLRKKQDRIIENQEEILNEIRNVKMKMKNSE
jgi:hypothetical protein